MITWHGLSWRIRRMGFKVKLRESIISCISSLTYVHMINGWPTDLFIPPGDYDKEIPSTSFLHLVMGFFCRMVMKARNSCLIQEERWCYLHFVDEFSVSQAK